MGVTSVRLVCHELHIIAHPFVWFVMNFASIRLFVWFVMNFISIRLVCHELRIIVYLFTWSVMGVTSVRLACHELHIVMNFTSIHLVCRPPCIRSSGLS